MIQVVRKFCANRETAFIEKYLSRKTSQEENLTPRKIVEWLDKFVISQLDAKRSIAIAHRNRWRRRQLPQQLRNEVSPKNILLWGPTGCGKTELARRMANLYESPFLKVEATKYTEVGYVGKDVNSIIEDLARVGVNNYKKMVERKIAEANPLLLEAFNEQVVRQILGPEHSESLFQEKLEELKSGLYDEKIITIWPTVPRFPEHFPLPPPYFPASELTMRISELRRVMIDHYERRLSGLLNSMDLTQKAIEQVEQEGIVFIDEIDKIALPEGFVSTGKNISTDGVQRDLLPIVEGTSVKTKYGDVNTDFILFIASGAFSKVKPNDLIPELLGRFPIKVPLKALTEHDFYRVLTEPEYNIIRQQVELLAAEGLKLQFTECGLKEVARQAVRFNQGEENLGVRRMHSLLERVMEQVSFAGREHEPKQVRVDQKFVLDRLAGQMEQFNLKKHML